MRARTVLGGLTLLGCSNTVPHPPYSPQPGSALVEVTAPPPPGRVEASLERPDPRAVWVDGEWTWRRRRWAWLAGRWVAPPAGATFSPWIFERGADGRLWYAPGTWRDAKGTSIAEPVPIATAQVHPVEIVNASGATENTGTVILKPAPKSP
jgi:hypothetical protein